MIQVIAKGPVLEFNCSLSGNRVEVLVSNVRLAETIAVAISSTYPIRHHLLRLNRSERVDMSENSGQSVLSAYLAKCTKPETRKLPKILSISPLISHMGASDRMTWADDNDGRLDSISSIELRVSDLGRWSTVFESRSGQKFTYPNPRKMGGTDISNDDSLVMRYTPRVNNAAWWDTVSFTGNLYSDTGAISRSRLKEMISPMLFSDSEYRYLDEASAVYARLPVQSKLPAGLHHDVGSPLHTLISELHKSMNRTEFLNVPLMVGPIMFFSCFAELSRGGYKNTLRRITTVVGLRYDDLFITWDSKGVGSRHVVTSRIISDLEMARIKSILSHVDSLVTRYKRITKEGQSNA